MRKHTDMNAEIRRTIRGQPRSDSSRAGARPADDDTASPPERGRARPLPGGGQTSEYSVVDRNAALREEIFAVKHGYRRDR